MEHSALVARLISELGQIGPWSWQDAYDTPTGRRWLAERLAYRIEEAQEREERQCAAEAADIIVAVGA